MTRGSSVPVALVGVELDGTGQCVVGRGEALLAKYLGGQLGGREQAATRRGRAGGGRAGPAPPMY